MRKLTAPVVIFWFLGVAVAHAQETYELTFSHFFSTEQGSHSDVVLPWIEQLETRSDGRISVTVRARDSWLGNVAQQYDQAESGLTDISLGLTAIPRGRFACTQIVELPYYIQSAAQADLLLMSLFPDHIGHEYDTVKLLGLWSHEPGVLLTRGVRVEKPEDLVGLRIGFPNASMSRILSDLGAEPVLMVPSFVNDAIESGDLDGAFVPWEHIWFSDFADKDIHVLDLGAYTVPLFLIMNKVTFEGLPPDLQDVVDSLAFEDWYRFNGGANRKTFWGMDPDSFYASVREAFVENGGDLVVPDDALRETWLAAAAPSVAALKAELAEICGQDLIDAADRFMNRD